MSIKNLQIIFILFLTSFFSLFLIGNPYISLIVMLGAVFCYIWFFIKPIIYTNFFWGVNALIFGGVCFIGLYNPMLTILLTIKLLLFLLVLSVFINLYYKKLSQVTKISSVLLGFYLLVLFTFLTIIKLYFFHAVSFFALSELKDPIFIENLPSKVFFSLNNYNFPFISNNFLFSMDFANEDQLISFAIQLNRSNETRWMFFYLVQLALLDLGKIHLVLVFF